jgi:hypothetical protein
MVSTPCTWKTDLAMSKPIVVTLCMARSSESWEPSQGPHPWHSRAGGGAVHSINKRLMHCSKFDRCQPVKWAWQITFGSSAANDFELSEQPGLGLEVDAAAVLFYDDVVAHRQAKPGTFARGLGCEERIEYFLFDSFWDAGGQRQVKSYSKSIIFLSPRTTRRGEHLPKIDAEQKLGPASDSSAFGRVLVCRRRSIHADEVSAPLVAHLR